MSIAPSNAWTEDLDTLFLEGAMKTRSWGKTSPESQDYMESYKPIVEDPIFADAFDNAIRAMGARIVERILWEKNHNPQKTTQNVTKTVTKNIDLLLSISPELARECIRDNGDFSRKVKTTLAVTRKVTKPFRIANVRTDIRTADWESRISEYSESDFKADNHWSSKETPKKRVPYEGIRLWISVLLTRKFTHEEALRLLDRCHRG